MHILRSVHINDLDALFELSKIQNFINLPSNLKVLEQQIKKSQKSFKDPYKNYADNYYIFVLENIESGDIVGTSMIHGKHGTEDEPHFFLKVDRENKYSDTMHLGYIHKTLKLGLESDGWTEIGGLILSPSFRGHTEKLGKQLSFVRFLYMGINQEIFTPIIHTELMPPFDEKGQSPLWEALGRRFMHMEYDEADQRSRKSKEFILSLFPSDTIYEALLPLDARQSIGEVGETTKPVKRMLEKIGFKYTNEIDPFDGGPHYRCPLKEITLVDEMKKGVIQVGEVKNEDCIEVLLATEHKKLSFFAFKCKIKLEKDKNKNRFIVNKALAQSLGIEDGQEANLINF